MIKLYSRKTPSGKCFGGCVAGEATFELAEWAFENEFLEKDEYEDFKNRYATEAETTALIEKRTGGLIEFY